jgi:hypothetical protein
MLGHYITCSSSVPFPADRNSFFQKLYVVLEVSIFLWMLEISLPEAQKSTRKCSSGSCEISSGDSLPDEMNIFLTAVRSLEPGNLLR